MRNRVRNMLSDVQRSPKFKLKIFTKAKNELSNSVLNMVKADIVEYNVR